MATGSSIELRRRLVQHLRRRGFLADSRVANAFLAVPREVFLPEHTVRLGTAAVYRDEAIVVRRDPASGAPQASSSQPAIMALMLEMLDARPGQRVLEVGAGTGYNAALLDRLTRPDGCVVAVDLDRGVAAGAAAALRRLSAQVHVVVADGAVGLPGPHAFDRIEVTASSAAVPRAWHDQLVPGGCLVVPLRLSAASERTHAVTAFRKTSRGFDSIGATAGGFMPLRRPIQGSAEKVAPEERREGAEAPVEATEPSSGSSPGHPLDVGRRSLDRLRIFVRYTDEPPDTRWIYQRGDHWIGVDGPAEPAADRSAS